MNPTASPTNRPVPLTAGSLSPALKRAILGLGGGALGIAVIGFIASFEAVSTAMGPTFGKNAPLVPLGIDLGILVFSGLHLLLIRLSMPAPWLRLIPYVLTAATVYLNISTGNTTEEKIAHGVMPALWAIFVEVASHAVAVHTGISTGKHMERIRRSRWLLAPAPTFFLWRRMVLWETTSYRHALGMERDRLLARAELASLYGWLLWRWRAPLTERVRLRLGELAPAGLSVMTERSTAPVAPVGDPHATPEHAPMIGAAPAPATTERTGSEQVGRSATTRSTGASTRSTKRSNTSSDRSAGAEQLSGTERSGSSGAPGRSGAPKLTDREAVERMLAAHREPDYEWGPREVHRLTGAGFGRIKKLIAMVAEHHEATGAEQASEQDRSSENDDKEVTA